VQPLELLLQRQPLPPVELRLLRLLRLQPLRPQLQRLQLVVHQRQLRRLLEHPILTALHLQMQLQPAQQLQQLRQLESRLLPSVQLQLEQLQVTSHLLRRL
jgi:hypothetical protein